MVLSYAGDDMADPISVAIATTALLLSATTAWLTLFRKGRVRMTQPTVIFWDPMAVRRCGRRGPKSSCGRFFLNIETRLCC